MVNNPLIRPYLLGGYLWGGYLRFPYQFPMVHGYSLAMNSEVIFGGSILQDGHLPVLNGVIIPFTGVMITVTHL